MDVWGLKLGCKKITDTDISANIYENIKKYESMIPKMLLTKPYDKEM